MNNKTTTATRRPILLDVMSGDRFLCQIAYTKRGIPKLIDGKMTEVHRPEDIMTYIREKRPSLANAKDLHVSFSSQKIFNK